MTMSFDGNIVYNLIKEWNTSLITGRINKIYQISKYDLLFVINTKQGKQQLLISGSPNYARCYITTMTYEKPDHPPTFCMFLRKQLEGGIITSIHQHLHDRIIVLDIQKRNELGDLANKQLILEMMGRYSNIIVTDEHGKILESIKHNMPFDGNERTIFPGAIYQAPDTTQINPQDRDALALYLQSTPPESTMDIVSNVMGFSPLVAKEIIYQHQKQHISLQDSFDKVLTDVEPTLIQGKRDYFYHIDVTHLEGKRIHYPTVNALLDHYYHERDQIDVIKQHSKTLTKFVKNYIQRLTNKIDKLTHEKSQTVKMDIYRIKGELIQSNLHQIEKGDTTLICHNYYDNKRIEIALDNKLSPIQNSKKYFKRYKKLKASIPHIERQIQSAQHELEYFRVIESQFDYATLKDIQEIKEELASKKYLKSTVQKKRKKQPNFDTYTDDDGIRILVGKNNIQNEYITHKLAKHTDVWFHVKGAPGAHVVVQAPFPLSETTIRSAAQLASYFSTMRHSSSVPVDYVEKRYLKKVPGKANSFVTYKNQKTIYIDPDETRILNMKKA
jgi:predicted ribosome quality control (RQC) complex YloA/Tae2 family protein